MATGRSTLHRIRIVSAVSLIKINDLVGTSEDFGRTATEDNC